MKREEIIVDGAKGFLGSRISDFLNLQNFKIHRLSRFSKLDFDQCKKYTLVIATGKFDGKIDEIVDSNISRPLHLVSKLKDCLSRIILLSTGAVYGCSLDDPRSKEGDVLSPVDIYSSSKMSLENLLSYFCDNKNIRFNILRMPIVYGEDNLKGVLPSMLFSYFKTNKIKVFNAGRSIRDFLYIDDFLNAFLKVLNHGHGGVFNISSEATYSMIDLARIITDNPDEIKIFNENNNKLLKLSLDYTKASNNLNYKPYLNQITREMLVNIYKNCK
mgnify:CR=1 FL=1